MIPALAVLFICYALDFVWVFYNRAVTDGRVGPAVWWSAMIMIITGTNIVEIGRDWHLIIPAAIGSALGTYHAMKEVTEHERHGA